MEPLILVIDDNTDIRENVSEILELAGYKTLTAPDGKKGVELALAHTPAVIVCDIMMPELDGYGVLHLLRKHARTQHIPFIFLTAKTERADLRRGMELGADDYIPKPFEDIELLNAVEMRLKKSAILTRPYEPGKPGLNRFMRDVHTAGLFEDLPDNYETQRYAKKQVLYQEGKRPRYLYYLVSGKMKISRIHEDGKEYILNLAGSGDIFGYAALIEDKIYDESAAVLEDAEVLQIPREDFLNMLYGDINIASKFIQIITQQVRDKDERLLQLAYGSLRKRVARALLDIVSRFRLSEKGRPGKPIEISREELAQYVGTATESLIRTLSDFKAEKRIDIHQGKIIVSDPDQLSHLLY